MSRWRALSTAVAGLGDVHAERNSPLRYRKRRESTDNRINLHLILADDLCCYARS